MNKILLNYVDKNKKTFIKFLFTILVGIILGVLFFETTNKKEIINYILNVYENIDNINFIETLKVSVKRNISTILVLGIAGLFLFGNYIIYGVLVFKGLSIGFTISSFLRSVGFNLDFIIIMISLIFEYVLMLPIILIMSEKSEKILFSIINKNVNLKEELCKHLLIMLILIIVSILSSLIEIYISMNFLIIF